MKQQTIGNGWVEQVADDVSFVHSGCCTAHWELLVSPQGYLLVCEQCGKPAQLLVTDVKG